MEARRQIRLGGELMIIDRIFDREKRNENEVALLNDVTQLGAYDNQYYVEQDRYGSMSKEFFTGYHYYILDKVLANYNPDGSKPKNSVILGYAPEGIIQSVWYNPFIKATVYNGNHRDVLIDRCALDGKLYPVDKDFYGAVRVFRIIDEDLGDVSVNKTIATIDLTADNNSIVESKMRYYPFRYFTIEDGFNPPLVIRPQYLGNPNRIVLNCKTAISESSNYLLYVSGYKGDTLGTREGMNSTASLDLPAFSSAFSTFMATSKTQHYTQMDNQYKQLGLGITRQRKENSWAIDNNTIAGVQSVSSNLMGMNLIGAGASMAGNIANASQIVQRNGFDNQQYNLNKQELEANSLAMMTDLQTTPRGVVAKPNNFMASIASQGKVVITEYRCESAYWNRAEKYFKRYGYKVNNYMGGSNASLFRSRQSFNYIKMTNCNIMGASIPKEDLEGIMTLFEKGITFWHVDRGSNMYDYNVANNEV